MVRIKGVEFNDGHVTAVNLDTFDGVIRFEPVKHGRWVVSQVRSLDSVFTCSECSREVSTANDYFGEPSRHVGGRYPYCHCGARMNTDKGEE